MGAIVVFLREYDDDLVLLASSVSSMRNMLRICDVCATQFNVLFNTNKSVTLSAQPGISPFHLQSLVLYRVKLYCVGGQMAPLGHIITNDCEDSALKKASLIGQVNTIIGSFKNVNSCTKAKLVKSYCTSFYGEI